MNIAKALSDGGWSIGTLGAVRPNAGSDIGLSVLGGGGEYTDFKILIGDGVVIRGPMDLEAVRCLAKVSTGKFHEAVGDLTALFQGSEQDQAATLREAFPGVGFKVDADGITASVDGEEFYIPPHDRAPEAFHARIQGLREYHADKAADYTSAAAEATRRAAAASRIFNAKEV